MNVDRIGAGLGVKEVSRIAACLLALETEKTAWKDFCSYSVNLWAFVIPGICACGE